MLDKKAIEKIIPHREPFLLIDRIVEQGQDTIVGEKDLTGKEDFFRGHFPQHPVMPGVLIIESLAQAGAVLILSRPEFKGKIAYFAGMDKVRFKRQVKPKDTLRLCVTITNMRSRIGFGKGEAWVGDELAASAEVIFAIGS